MSHVNQSVAAEISAAIGEGMIPAHVYGDPEVFDLERRHLFPHTWVFLGHTSEVPHSGDFVLRRIVDDSFIVTRDDTGEIRVHLNMCLHRGMQVCRAEMGNTRQFRCPYHAWSYRNDGTLAGLPFHEEAYGGERGLARAEHRLASPARVETYNGLIFAAVEEPASSLEDFLGDFRFYLDLYTAQSDSGLELRGPQRWRVNANWKIGCENFVGDMYHTPYTHRSVVDIGLFREPKAHKRKEGVLYHSGVGGGTTYKLPPGDFTERMRYVGYPDEMIRRMAGRWSPRQVKMVGQDGFMVSAATLFPNLSLVHNWPIIRQGEDVVPFISLRQWHPVSATETEVLSWFAVDAEAPEEFKADSYKAYLMCFGTSGMFEQDDIENWVSITTAARGSMARALRLNSRMGLLDDGTQVGEPLDDFPGPGFARVGYGEFNQRNWLEMWARQLHPPGRRPPRPGGRP